MTGMDWVLVVGVVMAGVAMILAGYAVLMVRHLPGEILSQLDTKIIEEIVEELPHTRFPAGPESPAYRPTEGQTRILPPDGLTHAQREEATLRRGVPGWHGPRVHDV